MEANNSDKIKEDKNTSSSVSIQNKTNNSSNKPNNVKNIQTANINKEELLKFVYDISFQNLTASSFKYALRNLKNDQKEKEEYILVKDIKYFALN